MSAWVACSVFLAALSNKTYSKPFGCLQGRPAETQQLKRDADTWQNHKAKLAWDLYLKEDTTNESFALLQLIANDWCQHPSSPSPPAVGRVRHCGCARAADRG